MESHIFTPVKISDRTVVRRAMCTIFLTFFQKDSKVDVPLFDVVSMFSAYIIQERRHADVRRVRDTIRHAGTSCGDQGGDFPVFRGRKGMGSRELEARGWRKGVPLNCSTRCCGAVHPLPF